MPQLYLHFKNKSSFICNLNITALWDFLCIYKEAEVGVQGQQWWSTLKAQKVKGLDQGLNCGSLEVLRLEPLRPNRWDSTTR